MDLSLFIERFQRKVQVDDGTGCWIWIGARNDRGYGQIWIEGALVYAHIHAWRVAIGPIPAGLEIDHLCRVPCCVNPAHLEPVTHRENVRRGAGSAAVRSRHAAQTHCLRGHELDETNTYRHVDHQGYTIRHCRECALIRQRNRRALVKANKKVTAP